MVPAYPSDWANHGAQRGSCLQPALSRGIRERGSTIWLHSSSTTTSKRMPSSSGIPAEQQVTPTTDAVFSFFLRAFSAPAFTCDFGTQESAEALPPSVSQSCRQLTEIDQLSLFSSCAFTCIVGMQE